MTDLAPTPPGLMISAPSSGTGKTTVMLGLLRALADEGIAVQPYKSGPDYIDPAFTAQRAGEIRSTWTPGRWDHSFWQPSRPSRGTLTYVSPKGPWGFTMVLRPEVKAVLAARRKRPFRWDGLWFWS